MKCCSRVLAFALGLATALVVHADPLVVVVESPAFTLDARVVDAGGAAAALVVRAESPTFQLDLRLPDAGGSVTALVVQAISPAFTLDLRLTGTDAAQGTLVVRAVSPAFTLDTRLATGVNSLFAAVVESGAFTLDTRLSAGASVAGLVVSVESPAFTLDTRLTTGSASLAALVVSAQSPAFTLDTRLSTSNPMLDALVVQAASPAFTLDTRLTPPNPIWATLVVSVESPTFTLDTKSGWVKTIFTTLAPYTGGGQGGKARFSPDGQQIVKADGARVVLWNLQDTRSPVLFSGAPAAVTTVEFSPLGDQLLTGSRNSSVLWWDTASRASIGQLSPGDGGPAYAAWSADGARLLAGAGTNLQLYSYPATNLLQAFAGISNQISIVALSPDGARALAGTADRTVTIWDTSNGQPLWRLAGHAGLITAAAFYPGSSNAMTASLDGTIRVWDGSQGIEKFHLTQNAPVADAVLSADGTLIASCNNGNPGRAYIWDGQSGALMRVFTDTSSDASQMLGVALSPDHTMLCTTHADGRVLLWDTGLTPQPTMTVTPLLVGTNAPVTLRSHGLYYFEVDAAAGRSMVVTLEAAGAGAPVKTLKSAGGATQAAGLSPDAEFANVGGVAPANPRLKSLRAFPSSTDLTAFRMTATKGRLPSEYDYEAFAQATVTNLHCEMPLAGTTSGKSYVLVFAPYLSAGSITARLRAEYADFHLSSVTPARGGNSGNVTAKVQGTGITPDSAVRLVNGGTSIPGQMAMWGDSTKAWFTFALSNAPSGTYHVEIQKPGIALAVVSNGFEVVTGVGPKLQTQLSAPSAVRPGRDYTLSIEYGNVGDVDMAAPLFVVSASVKVLYWEPGGGVAAAGGGDSGSSLGTLKSKIVQVGELQFLGPNQDGPPGILPPGAQFSTPIGFQGNGSVSQITFDLAVLRADSTPIDWALLESQLHPRSIAADLWSALWSNFKSIAGNTWADYLRSLDNQAHLLALSGQPSSDAGVLLQALFAQASGSPYRRTLAAGLDAQAPAPGLPLQFGRFFTDSLESRFAFGRFGRGWSDNFEYYLAQLTNDVVVIGTLGGGARSFLLGTDNMWYGQPGDYGSLSTNVAGFILTEKDGTYWQFNGYGQLAAIGDPNGNRIQFVYDSIGLKTIRHSAGPRFELTYEDYYDYSVEPAIPGVPPTHVRLRALQVWIPGQAFPAQTVDYGYDTFGHLSSVRSEVSGAYTPLAAYTYSPFGSTNGTLLHLPTDHALTSIRFPDDTHQYFAWDSRGQVVQQYRDGGAELLQFSYDPSGLVTVRDASNAVTSLRVSSLGQLLQMTDPLGRTMTFNYDASFNLVQLVGPTGDASQLAYDAQGNATNVVNPLGQQVSLGYGNLSRLTSLLDAKSQPMDFGYDGRGNLTQMGYADASAESFGYDAPGNVTIWTNRRGQAIQFARNALGQLTRKSYPDGRNIDFGYDSRGFLTNIADSAQGTTSLAFDARSFLTSITYPDGKGFSFEYNAAGRRTRRTGTDGYTLNYGYDAAGRLQTLTQGATNVLVSYTYDGAGRLAREDKGNGTFTTYSYDPASQVVAMTNAAPDGAVQSFFNYTYDARGNRVTMTTAAGLTAYEYDTLSQLTGVTYPGGRHVTYAYDAAGNRTVVNDNGTNTVYAANALNEYTQAGDATFTYDADGNMTSRTDATGTTIYQYDIENRLVSMSTPTNGVWQYTYDALGNRVAVVHNGVSSRYLHDPIGPVDIVSEYDGSDALVVRYEHALGLVSRTDVIGRPAFYSFDVLGNTREISDLSGTVLDGYDYDTLGEPSPVASAI